MKLKIKSVPDGLCQFWMCELEHKVRTTSLVFLSTVQSGSLCQNCHFICTVSTSHIWRYGSAWGPPALSTSSRGKPEAGSASRPSCAIVEGLKQGGQLRCGLGNDSLSHELEWEAWAGSALHEPSWKAMHGAQQQQRRTNHAEPEQLTNNMVKDERSIMEELGRRWDRETEQRKRKLKKKSSNTKAHL